MKYAFYHDYDYAIQYDGDGQHNPEYIEDMVKRAGEKELDIVIGSRFVTEKKPCSLRMIGNSLIEFCIYLTTGKKIKDSTSPFLSNWSRKKFKITKVSSLKSLKTTGI